MHNIFLNLQGNDEELLAFFAMCFSFVETAKFNNQKPGIFGQIVLQTTETCKKIIGPEWDQYLKQLSDEVIKEIQKQQNQ